MKKLGVSAFKYSPALRMAAHELLVTLPSAPISCDNRNGIAQWGSMLNDRLGCCTVSGLGHSIQVSTLNTGEELTPSDAAILQGYEDFCGYNPANPATDQGGIELDVISDVLKNGFSGQKLLGVVSPDPNNIDHVKKAIAYFGSIYIGANLPLSAQQDGGMWTVVSGAKGVAGSWGGHCMVSGSYDDNSCPWITWGENQDADWGWFSQYVEEVHVLVWESWMKKFPASTKQTILNMLQAVN